MEGIPRNHLPSTSNLPSHFPMILGLAPRGRGAECLINSHRPPDRRNICDTMPSLHLISSHPRNVAGRLSIAPRLSLHRACRDLRQLLRQRMMHSTDQLSDWGGWRSALHRRHLCTDESDVNEHAGPLAPRCKQRLAYCRQRGAEEPQHVSFHLDWAGCKRGWQGAQVRSEYLAWHQ